MDYNEIKRKIEKLTSRANDLNSEIVKRKTRYEMYFKQLEEEFQITPDKIQETIDKFESDLKEEESKLRNNMEKMEKMVTSLEVSLNEE